MHILGHFKTITKHKILVAKGCFKVGLYCQGIMHDMSKYSPTEFIPGAKYYQEIKALTISNEGNTGYPGHGCTIKEGTGIILSIGSITV